MVLSGLPAPRRQGKPSRGWNPLGRPGAAAAAWGVAVGCPSTVAPCSAPVTSWAPPTKASLSP